ncbi:MAG: hypothetical protein PHH35_02770 [Candidatus Pacebacteria bacterium]|nr:hypothetical protein [Candidatus Paceibacterota bacterium]
MFYTITQASSEALIELWNSFILFLPTFFIGLVVFIVGLIIGNGIAQLVEKIIDLLKIDPILEKIGFKVFTDKANIRLDSGYFLGQITKWLIILSFLVAACNLWGLFAVGDFITSIVVYLPNVLVAVLILLAAIILGEYFAKFIQASVAGAGLKYQNFLAAISRWTFLVFGIIAALSQLKVASYIVNTLFTGIVAMIAIAGGLAFGLGGKEAAQELLGKIKREME